MAYKYGRLAAKRPLGLRDITHYLSSPLPAAPAVVACPAYEWGMLGNDEYGDCTFAGAIHLREAVATRNKVTEIFPDDETVVEHYKWYTGCKEPGDDHDTGCVEADLLQHWYQKSLFNNKIHGYAPVNHRDQNELKSVVALFGGSYLGVAVPAPAQEQFGEGRPWDLTGTEADYQIEGGHCVPVVGYDDNYAYVVTWGKLHPVTWRWMGTYLEEAWAICLSEDVVNTQALEADLKRLTIA